VSKIGPVSDESIYNIAKSFAERVGKGEIVAKHRADESISKDVPF